LIPGGKTGTNTDYEYNFGRFTGRYIPEGYGWGVEGVKGNDSEFFRHHSDTKRK